MYWHKDRLVWKKLLENKEMAFKKWKMLSEQVRVVLNTLMLFPLEDCTHKYLKIFSTDFTFIQQKILLTTRIVRLILGHYLYNKKNTSLRSFFQAPSGLNVLVCHHVQNSSLLIQWHKAFYPMPKVWNSRAH